MPKLILRDDARFEELDFANQELFDFAELMKQCHQDGSIKTENFRDIISTNTTKTDFEKCARRVFRFQLHPDKNPPVITAMASFDNLKQLAGQYYDTNVAQRTESEDTEALVKTFAFLGNVPSTQTKIRCATAAEARQRAEFNRQANAARQGFVSAEQARRREEAARRHQEQHARIKRMLEKNMPILGSSIIFIFASNLIMQPGATISYVVLPFINLTFAAVGLAFNVVLNLLKDVGIGVVTAPFSVLGYALSGLIRGTSPQPKPTSIFSRAASLFSAPEAPVAEENYTLYGVAASAAMLFAYIAYIDATRNPIIDQTPAQQPPARPAVTPAQQPPARPAVPPAATGQDDFEEFINLFFGPAFRAGASGMPFQPGAGPFGMPFQPGTGPFGAPFQPGVGPFGMPFQQPAPAATPAPPPPAPEAKPAAAAVAPVLVGRKKKLFV
jgi:hypothetical protein